MCNLHVSVCYWHYVVDSCIIVIGVFSMFCIVVIICMVLVSVYYWCHVVDCRIIVIGVFSMFHIVVLMCMVLVSVSCQYLICLDCVMFFVIVVVIVFLVAPVICNDFVACVSDCTTH